MLLAVIATIVRQLQQLAQLARDVAARVQALLGEEGVAVAATNYATGESRPQVMTRLDSALRHIGDGENHRVEPLQQNVLGGGILARRDQILALIGGEQLTLQAQPIISPHAAGEVLMHEVLLRFSAGAEGLTLVELLSEVRRFGLASALDQRVIELSWAHLAVTPPSLRLAINLMPATLADDEFLHQLEARFIRQPALARRLAFEIPELAVARSQPLVARLAALLNRYHCALTIEHVGVAAAPFIYLRDLKPQQIKIDGRYLRAIPDAREKWQFIRALIQMGQGLGITVLAEQVESDEERQQLIERIERAVGKHRLRERHQHGDRAARRRRQPRDPGLPGLQRPRERQVARRQPGAGRPHDLGRLPGAGRALAAGAARDRQGRGRR